MILSTTDFVPGRQVVEVLGLVRGNTVRARHVGRDITAGLRHLVGGEIEEYTKVMAEAREQALDRMTEQAVALGADAVLMVRFSSAEVMRNAAEVIAYGTAVRLAPAGKD
ncbi:MAG: YbjQ family protein [Planctomycetota bacterium]|nr:MAG: YbjQ family protein [Planctomycetota bacterium]